MKNTKHGTVAITGDLFEKEEESFLYNNLQRESRQQILRIADFIVPGDGTMFKNRKKTRDL